MAKQPYTAEAATDELKAALASDGFGASIIEMIIAAIMSLLGGKAKEGISPAEMQECCKRRPLLARAQLRRKMADQGVPFRLRTLAIESALTIGSEAEPEKFTTFAAACQ